MRCDNRVCDATRLSPRPPPPPSSSPLLPPWHHLQPSNLVDTMTNSIGTAPGGRLCSLPTRNNIICFVRGISRPTGQSGVITRPRFIQLRDTATARRNQMLFDAACSPPPTRLNSTVASRRRCVLGLRQRSLCLPAVVVNISSSRFRLSDFSEVNYAKHCICKSSPKSAKFHS